MKVRNFISLFLSLSLFTMVYFTDICFAATHYVSSTGSATWANSTNIAQPCSLATANQNAAAGDIVLFRGGTYTHTEIYKSALSPVNSGNCTPSTVSDSCRITFKAYTAGDWSAREEVLIQASDNAIRMWGFTLDKQNSYIVISGIKFYNFSDWGFISSSSYNELSYCEFYSGPTSISTGVYIRENVNTMAGGSSNNFIHHNTFHNNYGSAITTCFEGGDLLHIGNTTRDEGTSRNNTVENCIFYAAGHTLTEDYGIHNVWRNNVGHNDGYKTGPPKFYGTATGGGNGKLIDTSRNFATDGVVTGLYLANTTESKKVAITSISTTTNINDTLNFTYVPGVFGSPAFSAGTAYAIGCSYIPDPPGSNPGDGKYGHRTFSMTNTSGAEYKYNLFEGNRGGYASINPVNNGADNFTLGSPGNIVRYNSFYGADGPGLNFKGYSGANNNGSRNRVYNNTLYKNGQYRIGNSNPAVKVGLQFYSSGLADNKIKNNLFYQNGPSPYDDFGGGGYVYENHEWANNYCIENVNGCSIKSGDPLFVNPVMTDMTSLTLPDLTLQATSPARNAGTYLTQAVGVGASSTTLIVTDALYFQDGTWGSDLTRSAGTMQADWISIGIATNAVQISSIDYTTNIITLASPMSWRDGAKIWLYKKSDGTQVLYGCATDIGAHEYFEELADSCAQPPQSLDILP